MDESQASYLSLPGKTSVLYSDVGGSSPPGSSCVECGIETANPKFCSRSCSAKYNNRKYPKRKRALPSGECQRCSKPLTKRYDSTYCSLRCSGLSRRDKVVAAWLNGDDTGLTSIGTLKPGIKEWLREVRGDACEMCGWNEVNPYTGKVPVVADHIDGDWQNNTLDNLRLLCPNCDSLQSTYKAANKGKGRSWRRTE